MMAPSTSGVVSKVLKVAKNIVLLIVLLTFVAIFYNYFNRYFKLKTPEKVVKAVPTFHSADSVNFIPVAGVTELSSDKTVDALLSGEFGPVVLSFVADWCGHCKNLAAAYESAAERSSIPFVRVQGQMVPVSSSKYGVAGYPTVFGISASGGPPKRFGGQRTAESLLEFANGLAGVPQVVPEVLDTAVVVPVPVAVVVEPVKEDLVPTIEIVSPDIDQVVS